MRFLFLMISFPDVRFSSSMYTDLAEEFRKQGHEVCVAVANGKRRTRLSVEGSIDVLRIKTMELFRTSFILKGIANILLPYQMIRGIRKHLGNSKFDAIILPTPPITFFRLAEAIKKKHACKIYLILRDIFPQNAKDLGLMRNEFVFGYFRKIERKLYNLSDSIGCMSKGNIDYIKKYNPEVSSKKLHLLYNWINPSNDIVHDTELKEMIGFKDKLIIVYGGNIGKPQDVDFIIDLAISLSSFKDVLFLIIGDGTEKNRMVNASLSKNVKNMIFWHSLPRSEFEKYISICDIGLVVNNRMFTIPNIPSRVLSYWNAGIPVLATLDPYTDFGDLLKESGSGLSSLTGELESFKRNFEKLYYNPDLRTKMGINGYKYLLENCTAECAYKIIIRNLN